MRAELLISAWLLLAAALVWGVPKLWTQSFPDLPSLEQTTDSSSSLASSPSDSKSPVKTTNEKNGASEKSEVPSSPAARALLEQSLSQLRNAPPLVAQLDLQINLLEREFLGTGQYCQSGVELVLGTDSYLKAFPYRLTFYQFRPSGEGSYSVQPVFELKLHHVEKRDEIAPEQFRLSADGLNPADLTKDYLNRVKMFTLYPLKENGNK